MWRFIISLLVLIISVWVGIKLVVDPGYVLLVYGHWSVEMPLWFTLIALVLSFFLGHKFLKLFTQLNFAWYKIKNWWYLRKQHKALSKTNRGFIQLIEQQWIGAENDFIAGITNTEAPLINYLLAAQAAHQQKVYTRRDAYLQKACQLMPEATIASGILHAQWQIECGELANALSLAKRLQKAQPYHATILKLLQKIYERLNDWQELLKLLPTLRKARVLTKEQIIALEIEIYIQLLRAAPIQGEQAVQHIWNNISRRQKQNQSLLLAYGESLLAFPHAAQEISKLILKSVQKQWHAGLVYLYSKLHLPNKMEQLTAAEDWLDQYSHQAELYYILAVLSVRCQLWGKAKKYFSESLNLAPMAATYIAYGKLLEQLHETEAALLQYRNGLELTASQAVS